MTLEYDAAYWKARYEAAVEASAREKRAMIALAVKGREEAVARERERCACLADELEATYDKQEPNPGGLGVVVSCHMFSDALRGPKVVGQ